MRTLPMLDSDKIILDLCAGTGAWSAPYQQAGYDVRRVTLPDQDVRLYIPPRGVYGILASPPCTDLSRAGAQYWPAKGPKALLEALAVADACMRVIVLCRPLVFWSLENPIGRLYTYYGEPRLRFNPCDYGDPYTKKTFLWGDFNIPEKSPVEPVFIRDSVRHKKYAPIMWGMGWDNDKRRERRSITPAGFARAFFEANR